MKPLKPLWRISVVTTAEGEDAVCELLGTVTGLAAAAWFDLESQTSHVSVYAEQGKFSPISVRKEVAAGLERIKSCGLELGAARLEIARIKREDWAESWKRHFQPIIIKVKPRLTPTRQRAAPAASLLVKPSWSRRRPAKNQAVVVLDPGLSFGTGQHPTTSFCLHEIARCRQPGSTQSFLDIGTGSGILAIAAVKLGYTPVQAFDFDPASVRVAGENARKNRVTSQLKPACRDLTKQPMQPARKFDLVCANLISNLLIAERWRIVNRLKPGGTLVLAGILAAEFGEVEAAFAGCRLKLRSSRAEKEWQSGAFCLT